MQDLSKVTHLVHIGYDGNYQRDFEVRVEKYLEATADEVKHVLNFVDAAMYSDEDIESMEENYFAEALSNCIAFQHGKSLGFLGNTPEIHAIAMRTIAWVPGEVLEYIKELLGDDWENLEKKIESFEKWKEGRSPFREYTSGKADPAELELPQSIKDEIEAQDGILKRIKGEEFNDMLQKLRQKFGGRNIFRFHSTNTPRNDLVLNRDRRGRILERAEGLFGKERIIFSAMRDGDINKVRHALLGEQWDKEVAKFKNESGMGVEVWEMLYGNADDRLLLQNRELSLKRFDRFRKDSFEQLEELGFQVTEETNHILGGEYFGRCVHAWADHLLIYGVNQKNLDIRDTLSLIHPDDTF